MKYSSLIFSALILLNAVLWYGVVFGGPKPYLQTYFLNIGQGDSTLTILPGGVKLLVDGGPDKSLLSELDRVLPANDRYIDMVLLTHPQLDHFSGFISLLERYKVGIFIWNGRPGDVEAWQDLTNSLSEAKTPTIILSRNDKINYKDSFISILSPDKELVKSSELNDTGIVAELFSSGIKELFTADIGFVVEDILANLYDLNADILKVGHHGSKYSSGVGFLSEASPLVSVIQVGKNNYGHPTPDAINRLTQSGSSVYRNDRDGRVNVVALNGLLNVFKSK